MQQTYHYCALFSFENPHEGNSIFPCREEDDYENWAIEGVPGFPYLEGYIKFSTKKPLVFGYSYSVCSLEIDNLDGDDNTFITIYGNNNSHLATRINHFLNMTPQFTRTSFFPAIREKFKGQSFDEIKFDRYRITIERCKGILKPDPRKTI